MIKLIDIIKTTCSETPEIPKQLLSCLLDSDTPIEELTPLLKLAFADVKRDDDKPCKIEIGVPVDGVIFDYETTGSLVDLVVALPDMLTNGAGLAPLSINFIMLGLLQQFYLDVPFRQFAEFKVVHPGLKIRAAVAITVGDGLLVHDVTHSFDDTGLSEEERAKLFGKVVKSASHDVGRGLKESVVWFPDSPEPWRSGFQIQEGTFKIGYIWEEVDYDPQNILPMREPEYVAGALISLREDIVTNTSSIKKLCHAVASTELMELLTNLTGNFSKKTHFSGYSGIDTAAYDQLMLLFEELTIAIVELRHIDRASLEQNAGIPLDCLPNKTVISDSLNTHIDNLTKVKESVRGILREVSVN